MKESSHRKIGGKRFLLIFSLKAVYYPPMSRVSNWFSEGILWIFGLLLIFRGSKAFFFGIKEAIR